MAKQSLELISVDDLLDEVEKRFTHMIVCGQSDSGEGGRIVWRFVGDPGMCCGLSQYVSSCCVDEMAEDDDDDND